VAELIISRPDGERRYPVPQFEQLSYRELATIERVTGVPAARWDEGMQSIMFPVALAYVATQRAGEEVSLDELEQLPGTAISIDDPDGDLDPTDGAEDSGESSPASEAPGTQDS
jgi:hypothetical protein